MRNHPLNSNPAPSLSPCPLSGQGGPVSSPLPGRRKFISVPAVMSIVATLLAPTSTLAGPLGEQLRAGSATVTRPDTATTVINQQTQRAVLDWQSFSVGSTEQVIFQQPGASSVTLNRVLGNDPSYIFGSLSANGQVFLINPHDVIFGPEARVDVHGLVASILNIANSDFMAGYNLFTKGINVAPGQVRNEGRLTAKEGGYIVLAGERVENNGVIEAQLGQVVLASGSKITLDLAGDQLTSLAVDEATLATLAGVTNSGQLLANGGRVLMTAKTAAGLAATVVNNQGLIRAHTIADQAGEILLLGDMDHGTAMVGGTLDASAPVGGVGGTIETSAATVTLDNPMVTAAAPYGKGGQWLINQTDIILDQSKVGALIASLNTGTDVTVQASAIGEGQGNITVLSAISKTGGGDATLTLSARNDINIGADITSSTGPLNPTNVVDPTSPSTTTGPRSLTNAGTTFPPATGPLNLVLNPDSDNLGGGIINLGAVTLDGNGGTINAAGKMVSHSFGNATINSAITMGGLTLSGGALALHGDSTTESYSQTSGVLQGNGALSVTNSFSNPGGSIDSALMALSITQTSGDLTIGGPITIAGALSLKVADGAAVTQTAPISAGGLELLGPGGSYTLTDANNQIRRLAGYVAAVELVNNQLLAIGTINTSAGLKASGDIKLTTTGLSELDGIVVNNPLISTDGSIALTTEHGIVLNAAEIMAKGNITLTANANGGSGAFIQNGGLISNLAATDPGDITINASDITVGAVSSKRNVRLNAGYGVTILEGAQDVHADDTYFEYALPFGFTYYGEAYDRMYVSTNGVITFGGGTSQYSNSDAGLIGGINGLKTIAPAWTDWDTRYYGNIYINRPSLSAISVNWDVAEYLKTSRTNQLGAVLNQAGDILFNYGPQIGEGRTPTIGVSKGDGVHYTLSSQNGTANLNNLPSLLYTYDPATDNYVETVGTPGCFGCASEIGNITAALGATIASGTGGTIELHASGNFNNGAGSDLFAPGNGGRWLVWSTDPSRDNRNGLAYDFKQYNALYGGTTVQGSGNGFLYSLAPVLTTELRGEVAKIYDGTTVATLSDENYVVRGAIDGDTVQLNHPALGSYDTKDAGTGKVVTVTGLEATASNNSATVYGYGLASTSVSGNIGTVSRRPVAVWADERTKVYGDPDPLLTFKVETEGVNHGIVAGERLTGTLTRAAGETVAEGPYLIQQGTLTNDNNMNYDIAYTDAHLTVNPGDGQGSTIREEVKEVIAAIGADIIAATTTSAVASDATASSVGDKEKKVHLDPSNQTELRQQPLFSLDAGAVAGQNMVCQ